MTHLLSHMTHSLSHMTLILPLAVYIVIAVYCVGAIVGLFCLLSPFVALIPLMQNVRYWFHMAGVVSIPYSSHRLPVNKVPVLEYRPDPRFPLTVLLCVSVTVWWLVERHSDYGWVLQDFLGNPLTPLPATMSTVFSLCRLCLPHIHFRSYALSTNLGGCYSNGISVFL